MVVLFFPTFFEPFAFLALLGAAAFCGDAAAATWATSYVGVAAALLGAALLMAFDFPALWGPFDLGALFATFPLAI